MSLAWASVRECHMKTEELGHPARHLRDVTTLCSFDEDPPKRANRSLSRPSAVHNISRTVMVAEAFRNGDGDLLGKAMTDTLHQPHRLPLIPGAQPAMTAAKAAGASAAALSGAGPSVIAFSSIQDSAIGEAMKHAFEERGLQARIFPLKMSNHGAEIQIR